MAVSWLVIAGILSMFVAVPQRVAAQTITVTNPTGSSVWYAGSSYTITWTWSGAVGANVKLEYDYTSFLDPVAIASSTSNDGSFSWTVPSIIDTHLTYFIRISDLSDLSVYDDSPYFEIVGGSGSGTITVTAPTLTDIWYTGSTYNIKWTTTTGVGPNVKIEYDCFFCSSDGIITSSTPTASGSYSWTVPTSLTTDWSYTITVSDASNPSVSDESPLFTIRPGTNLMLIIGVVAILAIVLIIVVVAVLLVARKKKAAPPPQANIPVIPPATQYAPAQYQPRYAPQQQVTQAPTGGTKMCINCGKSIPADFTFCIHCGGRT